jgi:hypothetical protein
MVATAIAPEAFNIFDTRGFSLKNFEPESRIPRTHLDGQTVYRRFGGFKSVLKMVQRFRNVVEIALWGRCFVFLPGDHPARDRPAPWQQGKALPSASPAVRPWRAWSSRYLKSGRFGLNR